MLENIIGKENYSKLDFKVLKGLTNLEERDGKEADLIIKEFKKH